VSLRAWRLIRRWEGGGCGEPVGSSGGGCGGKLSTASFLQPVVWRQGGEGAAWATRGVPPAGLGSPGEVGVGQAGSGAGQAARPDTQLGVQVFSFFPCLELRC